jgi:hypothetical protein
MLVAVLLILGIDFPISTATASQHYPVVQFADSQFHVFWQDLRFYPSDRATMAARVTDYGQVLDPEGVLMICDRTVDVDAAYDGTNFLVVVQDSC